MDLIPVADIDGFHANWTGWSYLWGLLTALGCDVDELSGSNDGDSVSSDTAEAFSRAVMGNLDRIHEMSLPGDITGFGKMLAILPEGNSIAVLSRMEGVEVRALRDCPDLYEWVKSFAVFCVASGGFAQY